MKMGRLRQGCLIMILVVSIGWAIACFSVSPTLGSPNRWVGIGMAFFSVGIAVGAWVLLRRSDRQEKLEKQQRLYYEEKVSQWEAEGYNVSEFKKKWFK